MSASSSSRSSRTAALLVTSVEPLSKRSAGAGASHTATHPTRPAAALRSASAACAQAGSAPEAISMQE